MSLKDLDKIILLWLTLVFLIFSCAVPERQPCFKDNRDCSKIDYFIDKEDWDSCYLRGCAYMDCNCLDLAIEEYKKAIHERPGDEMRARTYGLHFIRYYPHRELGIIYYQRDQIEEAIKELEQSIHDSPSSKGKYFLNQARKAWLQENNLDHSAPSIHVTSPKMALYYTNLSKISIEGYAEDDKFVSGLSINGESVFIELSAKTIPFSQTIPLEWGKNSITIEANDFFDRTIKKTLDIMVDKTGPLINFTHSSLELAYLEGQILIHGVVSDDSGVDLLSINGKPIDLENREIFEFSHRIPLTKDMRQIPLLAKDIAGNETRDYIDLSPENSYWSFSCPFVNQKFMIVSSGNRIDRLFRYPFKKEDFAPKDIQSKKGYGIRIAALDKSIPYLISSNDRRETLEEPYGTYAETTSRASIKIDPLPSATIFNEICLNGKIQYQTDISDINIFVNNNPVPMMLYDSDWLDKILSKMKNLFGIEELKSLSLSKIIELDLGQNKIVIEVCDNNGILRSEPIYVFRKKDEMREQKYRLNVAVMPVKDVSATPWLASLTWSSSSKETTDYVFAKLNEAFIRQKRFRIVDRRRLKQVLFEQKLAASDLIDKKKAIEVGRLVSAETIMSCDMRMKMGDSIELIGVMIDTETSLDIWSDDIYLPGDSDQILTEAAKKLAMKIRQHFPLCKGKILARKRGKIKIDLGHKDGICEYTRLIVYREGEWDSRVIAGAQVESVYDDHARALLLKEDEQNMVNVADSVITK